MAKQSARLMVLFLMVAALSPTQSWAQQVYGNLEGRITDPQAAAVPGVSVKARNDATGIERDGLTNEVGYYRIPFLPLGTYTVTMEMPGFKTVIRKNVFIDLNITRVVDVGLEVAPVAETITVEAAPSTIDTTSGEVKTSLDEKSIEFLPLGTRNNFLALVTLFPGFQENPTSGQNNPTLSSGSSVNFNGTGTRGASFQTDGINNDDSSENQNRQGVNVEAIREFQVLTNNFNAEHGRSYGAVVLVQTKSGTNDYNGTLYYYNNNGGLAANSFFRNTAGTNPATGKPRAPRVPFIRHQYGLAVGGPIVKGKWFFFTSYDNVDRPGAVGYTRNILFPDERTPRVPADDPFKAQKEAWIKNIISFFPDVTPNAPEISPRAYRTQVGRIWDEQDFSTRVDWNLSQRDNVFFRFQTSKQDFGTEEVIKGEFARSDHEQYNFGTSWVHVFSLNTVGEFRLGVGRRDTRVTLTAGRETPIIRWIGEPGSNPIIGNAGAFPILRFQTDFQGVYNLSLNRGNHDIRVGTDTRRQHLNDLAENFGRGWWIFRSGGGFGPYQNFLRGTVQQYIQAFGPFFAGFRMFETNNYIQDNWKVSPNLTLGLGFRYEVVTAPSEVNDKIDFGYDADLDNWEPRIGFAWSPSAREGFWRTLTGGPNRFSIRGGYGVFHGRLFQSIFSQGGANVRTNPPNAALISLATGSYDVHAPLGSDFVFQPGDPSVRVSVALVDPGLEMPYTQHWNLTLERQFPRQFSLSVGYVGNRGIGLLFYDWQNRAEFPFTAVDHPFNAKSFRGVTFNQVDTNPRNSRPAAGTISVAQPRTNERRPNPLYSGVTNVTNRSWTYYHALQAKLTKRFSDGVTFLANYTWGKGTDTGSESTFVGPGDINAAISATRGPESMKGPSRFDVRHRFSLNFGWQLPWLLRQRSIAGQVLGGWNLGGQITYATGNPFTVFAGYDLNFDGVGGDRPDVVNPSILGTSVDKPFANPQLDPSAFALKDSSGTLFFPLRPGLNNLGLAGRNAFRLDGTQNWNLGLYKTFRILEGHSLMVRVEAFNALNTPQFSFPDSSLTLGSSSLSSCDPSSGLCAGTPNRFFGRITSVRTGSRNIQFGLRYSF